MAEKFFSVAAREDGRDGLLRGAALDCADCCEARRWSARSACEAFRAASVCVWMDVPGRVWMDVPGRVWMDAMEVAHV